MGPGMGGGFRHLNFMQKELGLTDQQVKQIFDIGTQYREKRFENRNNPDKLAELRTEHRKAVESVFTKEQLEKFNKFRDDRCRCGQMGLTLNRDKHRQIYWPVLIIKICK